MTKPDPNVPDPGTPDDDAVWLDLVARLEGVGEYGTDSGDVPRAGDKAAGEDRADSEARPAGQEGKPVPGAPAAGASGSGSGTGSTAGAAKSFRDFDPLGLAGTAPIELSAAERLAPGRPAAGGAGEPAASGPRDYEPEDDDGAFVPEEPPSLAGADPLTVLAWLGAVGGPIALVLAAMFWRSAPLLAILGIVVIFAASVVFLIMKLPGEKDEHDDGARV